MPKARLPIVVVTLVLLCTTLTIAQAHPSSASAPVLPLSFEINQGQTDPQVRYLARSREGTLFFTRSGVTVSLPRVGSFRMLFDRGNSSPSIDTQDPMAARSNYLTPRSGQPVTNVENFGSLRYSQIYPGIDVRFNGHERHMEHEFQITPGADPSRIALQLEGIDAVRIAGNGDAELTLGSHTLRESAPVAWQTISGHHVSVAASWKLLSDNRLGINLGKYDRDYAVTIDPVLAYSTHLGGSTGQDVDLQTTFPADTGIASIVLDPTRNIYVAGSTSATDFPTTAGAFDRTANLFNVFHEETTTQSGFVAKFDPTGHTLIWSTFLRDSVPMIAVDSTGHVYATKGGEDGFAGPSEGFDPGIAIDKLSADGSHLLYSFRFAVTPQTPVSCQTAFGGTSPTGIVADNTGHVWVVGNTDNPCMPTTAGVLHRTLAPNDTEGFIAKFDTAKSGAASIMYSTYWGSNGANAFIFGLAVDTSGNTYLVGVTNPAKLPHGKTFGTATAGDNGIEGYVAKVNATASSILFSTIVNGVNFGFRTSPRIVIDSSRNVYVAGTTSSSGFPTTAGAFQRTMTGGTCNGPLGQQPCTDAFVLKLNALGNTLLFSTLLGGSGIDGVADLRINSAGMPFVTGTTTSTNFPTTANAFKRTYPAGATGQAFVTALNANGQSLYYSTLLGGSQQTSSSSIFVDQLWNAWVAGGTQDLDYPVTPDSFQPALLGHSDAFIAKIVIASDLSLRITAQSASVLHNATDLFTDVVTNKGPDGADNVVLTNPVPAGFSYGGIPFSNASSCTQPAIGATTGSVVCTKTHLNPGATFQVQVKLRAIAPAGSKITQRASTKSKMQDLTQGNNSASFTVTVK